MTDYSQLEDQLDKVGEAAVEAAMHFLGFREGSCAEGEFRSTVNLTLPEGGGGFNPVDMIVTYPGGDWYATDGYNKVPFEQTSWAGSFSPPFVARPVYNMWRGGVTAAFANWKDLPHPREFNAPIETIRSVAKSLNAGGASINGAGEEIEIDGGDLVLDGYISYIGRELAQFNGTMIDTFDANYASRVRPTVAGQHVLTCVLGTMLAGEQEAWKRTRQDVIDLAVQAETAFKGLKTRQSADWKQVLQVAGTVAAAASLFATGGAAAPAIGAARTVLTIVTGFVPDAPDKAEAELSGSTPGDVLESISDSLRTLNTALFDQEDAFHQCGKRALDAIEANRQYFDIATPTDFLENDGGEYFKAGENLTVLMPHLRQIAARFDLIAQAQSDAAASLEAADGSGKWTRWSSLGYSYNGHYDSWKDLYTALDDALSSSAKEMRDVAERLVLVSYDFEATEEQIEAAIRQATEQVRDAQPQY